jgi:hypothetical protein
MELGLLFWPQTPGLLSWGPQVPSPAGRANLRSRLLRTPSDQAAVVAVLNGHFLCQFVRMALIIGRGQRPFFTRRIVE